VYVDTAPRERALDADIRQVLVDLPEVGATRRILATREPPVRWCYNDTPLGQALSPAEVNRKWNRLWLAYFGPAVCCHIRFTDPTRVVEEDEEE